MAPAALETTYQIQQAFAQRNATFETFFARESRTLAIACREMSERFASGGRLLAIGRGAYATDCQHVSVEFVHPVIVGKRALPALDLSFAIGQGFQTLLRPQDIVMGFGPPESDSQITAALADAANRGAMTFALPGHSGSYFFETPTSDPFVHQELIEILYHTLWETVHVFFEHREMGHDVGNAGFLYPFLGRQKQDTESIVDQVAESICVKVSEDSRLRLQVAGKQAAAIAEAAAAMTDRVRRGGQLILFGNGGSATDANDWAVDCIAPPPGFSPIPAISLSLEPANITALANDVGTELVFLRQLIAQARENDVAIGISTSGGSKNVIAALEEARKRGLLTAALLGYDGGEIVRRKLVHHALVVPSDYIPRIQEVQASTYHTICEMMQKTLHASN